MFDTCLILAGGRGTRLSPYTDKKHKSLVQINGSKFIEYIIEHLNYYGISNIVILTGYLSDQFQEIEDKYKNVTGISVRQFRTAQELNTCARVYLAKKYLEGDILVCYGDVYTEVNLTDYYKFYKSFINNYCSISALSRHCKISTQELNNTDIKSKKTYKDIGFFAINANLLKKFIPKDSDQKFEDWINKSGLVGHIYKDNWLYNSLTDEDSMLLLKDLLSEKVTLLLDRDGVLNQAPKKAKYVKSIDDIILNIEIIEIIKSQKKNIERIIIFTNQPWISKDPKNKKISKEIENYFISIFSDLNVKIFYLCCPHSFEERCECRKPKIGNIIKLSQFQPFLRRKIIFVGDSNSDKQAADLIGGVTFFSIKSNKFTNEVVSFEKAFKPRLCPDHRYYRLCGLTYGRFNF